MLDYCHHDYLTTPPPPPSQMTNNMLSGDRILAAIDQAMQRWGDQTCDFGWKQGMLYANTIPHTYTHLLTILNVHTICSLGNYDNV